MSLSSFFFSFPYQLKAVCHDRHELDHLDRGHVLFPPDVLLVLWSQGGHQIIGVHQDVDEGVLKQEKRVFGCRVRADLKVGLTQRPKKDA